jgi:hypothetical protein
LGDHRSLGAAKAPHPLVVHLGHLAGNFVKTFLDRFVKGWCR